MTINMASLCHNRVKCEHCQYPYRLNVKDEFLFFSFLFLFLEMAAKSELRGSVGGENKIKKTGPRLFR